MELGGTATTKLGKYKKVSPGATQSVDRKDNG